MSSESRSQSLRNQTLPPEPARPARSRWGLLAQRNFRLLWVGETASKLGSSITTVALPLVAAVSLDAGPFAVGLLTAAVWLPWLFLGLPVGVWVGRLPARAVMLTCNVVSMVVFASVPVAGWLDVLSMPHLLAVALLGGVASVFFTTAYQVYLPEIVGQEDLIEGNSKLQGGASAAQVAGPGVGGLLAQLFGAVTGLLADAGTFLVSTIMLMMIRTPRKPSKPRDRSDGSLFKDVADGLRFIVGDPFLRSLTTFGAAANFALTGYQSILVLFLIRDVGAAPGMVGALAAAGALGGILGAAVARPICRRLGTARGPLLVQLVAAPFGLLLPMTTGGATLILFVMGSILLVSGAMVCNVVFGSFRQSYTPPALLSRVVATSMFVNHGTIPVGALVGAGLGSAIGLRSTMWVMTGLLVLCSGILLASPLRRLRDMPTGTRVVS
ncbi:MULTISPECIES: MFS transporter [unclassified Streptomyces]|uniref:MFS transporter n=1 Tax=unclassified Streptomyces TaxID=2593676 RepID=UPI0011E7E4C0|nr:MFS transporter [Streptomyces sp. sk2.1]TXS75710.1 MFS transporter [Streptomyces sp. sk2.1]